MKKLGTYWKVYIILILVLLVAGIALSIYTKNSLETYEKSQPENIVKSEMAKIKNAAKYNTFDVLMDLSKYDKEVVEQYYKLMNEAKNWSCKVISGGYSDTAQSWGIYADDNLVAKVNLTGTNTRTILLILSASDWSVDSLVSGLDLMPSPTPGPTEGPIIITKYEYNLTLPATYKVLCENQIMEGQPVEDKINYNFITTQENIAITDAYGDTITYHYGDTITGHNILVKIPDVFTISIDDVDVTQYALPDKEDIKALSVCREFTSNLPGLIVYHFDDALVKPAFVITDQNGKNVDYEYDGDALIISNLAKSDTIPEEITSVTDIMSIAEKWSLLMTRDLGYREENYGYDKITKYIVKNSPLLNIAKSYINSDIWTISNHVLADPPFSDESVGGYIRYSDNIFSVDVHLKKSMLIRGGTEYRYDVTSDTIFFIKNTGAGEPWLMVDMMSNLEK